jgi:hypothetical protein
MSTVFAGVTEQSYPGWTLTQEGVDGINTIAADIMAKRYPEQVPWVAVPGGEASVEWNRLVNGNHYGVPNDKQVKEIFGLLVSIPQTYPTPEEWWLATADEDEEES